MRHVRFKAAKWIICSALIGMIDVCVAQVSNYTFTQESSTWQPLAGQGTLIGYNLVDDEVFVIEGDQLGFGLQTSGNGWPIGFTFHFNGVPFDRVGLSTEGWLSFGNSSDGAQAVYMPIGSDGYTPISTATNPLVDPRMRHRIVPFANDLRARNGIWPLQLRTIGTAPNRTFVVEWNVASANGALGGLFAFQVRLEEGGGLPSSQVVRMVYGPMSATSTFTGQVGLGGMDPSDFINRSVSVAPYDWNVSTDGTLNTSTCRIPTVADNLPQGLTYVWTPPACSVAGVEVSDLQTVGGAISGSLSWEPVPGATTYDYVITAGGPDDPPFASGSGLSATTAAVSGLPSLGALFAYVRANCTVPGPGWTAPYAFATDGIIEVVCGEAPLVQDYCYDHFEQKSWLYTSSSSEPLRLIFHAGNISFGDVLTCYDGADDTAPVLFTAAVNGTIEGQVVNTTGEHLFMRIVSDGIGSCADLPFVLPLEWEVGCADCDPVLASFEVVQDCGNEQFSVNVNIFSMGSATSVSITNDGNAAVVTANGPGQYSSGPYPVDSIVVVTAANTTNDYCSFVSPPLASPPCPIVSCGPDTYTYCYTDMDVTQRIYRATGSERIGVRFLSGSLAGGDILRVYDGDDIFTSTLLETFSGADLTDELVLSSVSSNTLLLEVASDAFTSCATGSAIEWNYIVSCYTGCEPPEATFTVQENCAAGTFSVLVSVTSMGSAAALTLTNNGGAAEESVSFTGSYTVGPFTNGTPVVVELNGADVLCSLNSSPLVDNCPVGIRENDESTLMIYPNPGTGIFRVQLPSGFGGVQLEVFDIAGRRVAGEATPVQGLAALLDLGHLPDGSYLLVVRDGQRSMHGTLRLIR